MRNTVLIIKNEGELNVKKTGLLVSKFEDTSDKFCNCCKANFLNGSEKEIDYFEIDFNSMAVSLCQHCLMCLEEKLAAV